VTAVFFVAAAGFLFTLAALAAVADRANAACPVCGHTPTGAPHVAAIALRVHLTNTHGWTLNAAQRATYRPDHVEPEGDEQ
jgi:hypothetical protein